MMPHDSLPEHLTDHFEDPYHRGSCDRPTHRAAIEKAGCGDTVTIELQIINGVIREAWFEGEGCILSQSVASLLVEQMEGQSLAAFENYSAADLMKLVKADIEPHRRACCQLPLDVARLALNEPLDDDDEGPTFLGLNLGDEC